MQETNSTGMRYKQKKIQITRENKFILKLKYLNTLNMF
jgi:hypothetical protein